MADETASLLNQSTVEAEPKQAYWWLTVLMLTYFARRYTNEGLMGMILALGMGYCIYLNTRKPKHVVQILGCALFMFIGLHSISEYGDKLDRSSNLARNQSAPAAAPQTATDPAQEKRDFINSVDESITGKRLEGNLPKFIGKNVDLHGKVEEVTSATEFVLDTGIMSFNGDGNAVDTTARIYIECNSTKSLEGGQQIRVIGTVDDAGTSAPTIKAKYME